MTGRAGERRQVRERTSSDRSRGPVHSPSFRRTGTGGGCSWVRTVRLKVETGAEDVFGEEAGWERSEVHGKDEEE